MARDFAFAPAVRERVPLLVGIVGPSGTGKTFSGLRVAEGIRRVTGGRIKVIDTEHRRAKQYADYFDFDHCDFQGPFGSLDYLRAIETACATPGPVLIDSMSHEHDGPDGYLEFHEAEVERLCKPRNQGGGGFRDAYSANVPAWAKPAEARRKLIQGIIRLGVNAVFCFRAKEKVDMNAKREDGTKTVGNLGWMPIAGDAFVYEMTLKCLLLPGADGVPTWYPDNPGEKAMAKLPIQFREMFGKDKVQLSEDVGEQLARWAAGSPDSGKKPSIPELLDRYLKATTREEFDAAEKGRAYLWGTVTAANQKKLKDASNAAAERLAKAPDSPPPPSGNATGNPDHVPGVDEDGPGTGNHSGQLFDGGPDPGATVRH